MLHFGHINFFCLLVLLLCSLLISCLFGCCSCFVLPLLNPSFQNLVFKFHIGPFKLSLFSCCFFSCCHSSRVVIPLAMLFFSCCRSFSVVVFHALSFFSHCCFSRTTLLTLLLSCYNYALFLLRCNPSPVATPRTTIPIALLFSPCYSFHVIVPFALFFSNHCAFQVPANPTFVVFLVLLLLLLSCYYSILFGQYGISPTLAMCKSEHGALTLT